VARFELASSLVPAVRMPLLVVARLERSGDSESSGGCLRFPFRDRGKGFVSTTSCLELDWALSDALPLPDLVRVCGVVDS
jgi:hypothetical protein